MLQDETSKKCPHIATGVGKISSWIPLDGKGSKLFVLLQEDTEKKMIISYIYIHSLCSDFPSFPPIDAVKKRMG